MTTEQQSDQYAERIARLEGIAEQMNERLSKIEGRLNTLVRLIVGTWITTILTVLFTR